MYYCQSCQALYNKFNTLQQIVKIGNPVHSPSFKTEIKKAVILRDYDIFPFTLKVCDEDNGQ